ncbi:MAG TPA: hypothetical protein VGA67_05885 [Candidatus Dojkabacteria bacterium]|jgi:hypothetical protein
MKEEHKKILEELKAKQDKNSRSILKKDIGRYFLLFTIIGFIIVFGVYLYFSIDSYKFETNQLSEIKNEINASAETLLLIDIDKTIEDATQIELFETNTEIINNCEDITRFNNFYGNEDTLKRVTDLKRDILGNCFSIIEDITAYQQSKSEFFLENIENDFNSIANSNSELQSIEISAYDFFFKSNIYTVAYVSLFIVLVVYSRNFRRLRE